MTRATVLLCFALSLTATAARADAPRSPREVVAADGQTPAAAPRPDGKVALDRLRSLAGTWKGTVARKDGPPAEVRWEVISAGTAVMETLFPGTDHEMRSVYFVDGGALVLTHYCAMGNQPRMKLAPASTPTELVFEFDGGTNLDAARDVHVHDGRIRLLDADHLEAEWSVRDRGQETGRNRFFLARAR